MSFAHTVRSLVFGMPRLVTGGRPSERAGEEGLACEVLDAKGLKHITVISPAFTSGSALPGRYAKDGENLSPPLRWGLPPKGTRSLALIVEDPDAPSPKPFVHWLVGDLEPFRMELAEGILTEGTDYLVQGKNSTMRAGYIGAAPPKGDDPHRYFFQLFALNARLGLEPGFGRSALIDAMQGHVIGYGETIGTYRRG